MPPTEDEANSPLLPHAPLPGEMAGAILETLLETSDDAIFSKTPNNVIVSWSRGAERMYGYAASEVVGQPVTCLAPPALWAEMADIQKTVSEGRRVDSLETVRQTKSGGLITIRLTVSPAFDASGAVIGAVTLARNITDHKNIEQSLRRMQSEAESRLLVMDTVNQVAVGILTSQTGVEALRHIAEAARALVGARYAALGVARADGQGLTEFVTVGLTPQEEAAIGPRPVGRGVLGLLLSRAEPLRIPSLAGCPASAGFPPNHPAMEGFLGVPIRRGDMVIGSLYLTNKITGAFTEADELAVQALSAHAAVAILNFQMLSRQRTLVRGLISAQEEERRAVAYDLHDGLTQFVMAAHAHLEAFKRAQAGGKAERAARERDQGLHYLKEAVVESRRLINGLRSLALDDLGLAGAIEQMVHEEKARADWQEADLVHNIAEQRFDPTLETAVYRVAQEALTNARKHADAERVQVLLLAGRDEQAPSPHLTLEVRDWGRGFVPEEKVGETERVGLHSMAERVLLMGGTYHLHSAPGAGTVVTAVFPVSPPRPNASPPGEPSESL